MKLIVFGATGGTGREAAARALARGDQVTVFVRSPDKVGIAGVNVIQGDVFDPAAVAAAIAGHDAVITSLGTRPWRYTDVCSRGTRNITAGMKQAGVRRIVCVSSLGVGETRAESGLLTRLFAATVIRRELADKAIMERDLMASDLDWVIVRPTLLTNGAAKGNLRAAVDGSIKGGFISRADVAEFCLAAAGGSEWVRRAPVITG
jgi:putative NADH-flavin reductase